MLEALILVVLTTFVVSAGLKSIYLLIVLLIVEVVAFPGIRLLAQKAPPFVPTARKTVRAMLDMAAIEPGDTVYDLGCGDGRFVFAAVAKGAEATGYEYSVFVYLLAKFLSLFHPGSSIRFGDFWKKKYRDADVIFCYLLPEGMARFGREIWPTLKPGCRVVSNAFLLKDVVALEKREGAYLYRKE
jgi:SAM-dependent methyltransferase